MSRKGIGPGGKRKTEVNAHKNIRRRRCRGGEGGESNGCINAIVVENAKNRR